MPIHDTNEPVIRVPKAIPITRLCATPTGDPVLGGHVAGDVGDCVGTMEHDGVTVTVMVTVTSMEGVEVRIESGIVVLGDTVVIEDITSWQF